MKNRAAFVIAKALQRAMLRLEQEGELTPQQSQHIFNTVQLEILQETEGEYEIQALINEIALQLAKERPSNDTVQEVPREPEEYNALNDENLKVQAELEARMQAAALEVKKRNEEDGRLQEARKRNSRLQQSRSRVRGRARTVLNKRSDSSR
jgi:hypothetical protein